jgi:hypothetical protein
VHAITRKLRLVLQFPQQSVCYEDVATRQRLFEFERDGAEVKYLQDISQMH